MCAFGVKIFASLQIKQSTVDGMPVALLNRPLG